MKLLIDLFKGKLGLAKTYWIWGVLIGSILAGGTYLLLYLEFKYLESELIEKFVLIYSIFIIFWSIFICTAIINSASYNRKRGGWGWIASILAVTGIIKSLYGAAVLFGLMSTAWTDLEKSIRVANLALPSEIGDGIMISEISLNKTDKSIRYHVAVDVPTLNKDSINLQDAKEGLLEECDTLKEMLSGTVNSVIYRYTGNDGTMAEVKILPKDCNL